MAFSNSNYSNTASVTTAPAPDVQLAAPSTLTATELTPAQTDTTAKVQLNWISNSGGNESGFGVEKASWSAGPWSQVAVAPKNAVNYIATGLPFSTLTFWRVRALA